MLELMRAYPWNTMNNAVRQIKTIHRGRNFQLHCLPLMVNNVLAYGLAPLWSWSSLKIGEPGHQHTWYWSHRAIGTSLSWTWWHHQMETLYKSLAICAGHSLVTSEFPTQRPVTWSLDVFFDLRLNKRLSKQSWDWWFETSSPPLWRHCNEKIILCLIGGLHARHIYEGYGYGITLQIYRKLSNIRRTQNQNLNVSRLNMQPPLPNPLKPGVKSRMKM